ncbi:MerR family transcriptional regulator [Streptomyces rugosispiralis]|uniref:MerR family transcriptional regulator n=1 Tax=Streptomyces rugosispiralis TaxID=2967341 RepID=A0ABT1V159_9ACTN|nr:MerR family transcriptional regulator [Streptomyces rugosispiralis]MCQ8191117.1 MerR family transcriptional regulator [Streptomyces rugosispiralis]
MRIGELATRTGVSVRALRYYEEQGLLTSERSPSGQRRYADSAVDRVLWIQCLYAAGLSSRTIREFLPCTYASVATPADIARLTAERDRINAQMADLATTRDRLDAIIAAASGTAGAEACGIAQSA